MSNRYKKTASNSSVVGKTAATKIGTQITCTPYQHELLEEAKNRRLYLEGDISCFDLEDIAIEDKINVSYMVKLIKRFNAEDSGLAPKDRRPIWIYINCPGGEVYEGWPLIEAIKLSKTPVYTVNMGMCASMAFLISITGHKRFSMPNMTFLMHDGTDVMYGSAAKVQDEANFRALYNKTVIKSHILEHSKLDEEKYAEKERVEWYMLSDEALKYGFIDKIIEDFSEIT